MKPLTKARRPYRDGGFFFFLCALGLLGAGGETAPLGQVRAILEGPDAPAELRGANPGRWSAWAREEDRTIRLRLEQGELDSMVNLMLYGTSFTKRPRIRVEDLARATRDGTLRGRVEDLLEGLRSPGPNERLRELARLLRRNGVDPEGSRTSADAGVFLYKNLERVLKERQALAQRASAAAGDGLARGSVFRDRGVSLDTGIFPNFSIEQTLRDLKQRGLLRAGQVRRAAVIGPGLDLIDKNDESGFDYYPPQTVQPFALYDSLARLKLSIPDLRLGVFDLSPRVITHLERAREQARRNSGYTIQLPRDIARAWPSDLARYWRTFGDHIGEEAEPIAPPPIFRGLETRAVRVRPAVVLACEPADLDVIVERAVLPEADRYDLIVATNIFLYYRPFEQQLALQNVAAMLKPGGLLLVNDRMPELPDRDMALAGITDVHYDGFGSGARDPVGWYQKR